MPSGGTHRGIPENVGDVSGPDHQLQLYLMVVCVWGGGELPGDQVELFKTCLPHT